MLESEQPYRILNDSPEEHFEVEVKVEEHDTKKKPCMKHGCPEKRRKAEEEKKKKEGGGKKPCMKHGCPEKRAKEAEEERKKKEGHGGQCMDHGCPEKRAAEAKQKKYDKETLIWWGSVALWCAWLTIFFNATEGGFSIYWGASKS